MRFADVIDLVASKAEEFVDLTNIVDRVVAYKEVWLANQRIVKQFN